MLFLLSLLKDAVSAVYFLLLLSSHLILTSPFSMLETTTHAQVAPAFPFMELWVDEYVAATLSGYTVRSAWGFPAVQ